MMKGIATLCEGKSLSEAYVAPSCSSMELNCEGSFCLVNSRGGLLEVKHDDFVGSDYTGGWDY